MRWAILFLLSGILTMADYSPKDLAQALMMTPAAAQSRGDPAEAHSRANEARAKEQRALSAPGRISEAERDRLSGLVMGGEISKEDYEAATRMNNAPEGIDP